MASAPEKQVQMAILSETGRPQAGYSCVSKRVSRVVAYLLLLAALVGFAGTGCVSVRCMPIGLGSWVCVAVQEDACGQHQALDLEVLRVLIT
jgi:hypothetical protein